MPDMVRPIMFLYTATMPDENDPIAKLISAALKLWVVAFRDISQHRRKMCCQIQIQSLSSYWKTLGTSHQESWTSYSGGDLWKRCLLTQLTRRKWKTLDKADPDSFFVMGIFNNQLGDTIKEAHHLAPSLRRTGKRMLIPDFPEMGS